MTFVLVHGMSHGAWAWEFVRARLARAGHQVLAVDLPGHGRRAHERARASITSYARAVADAMTLAGAHDTVIVGHSMAGAVIPKVAAPRTYIRCLRDMAVPAARAAQYAARLGVTPVDMDCAHNPMLSQPDALAATLEKL